MQLNQIIRVIICLIAVLVVNPTFGQSVKNQKVINLHAGSSLVGGAIDLIVGSGEEIDTHTSNNFVEINNSSVSGGRALLVGFDYGLSSRWSLGGFFSTQRRHGTTEFSYEDASSVIQTETIKFNLRRNSIGFTPKVHYGNRDRIDLYSGVRMGWLFWVNSIESTSGKFDLFDDMITSRPFFGLTAFGARVYPTDNIGLNFELNLGAPNIIGLGAVIKLP